MPFSKNKKVEDDIIRLESEIAEASDRFESGRKAFQLAQLYFDLQQTHKVISFARLAGDIFVSEGKAGHAIAVYKWLQRVPEAKPYSEDLIGAIAESFSRQRRKPVTADDKLPLPTPYQEFDALVSLEEAEVSRSQIRTAGLSPYPLFSLLKAKEMARLVEISEFISLKSGEKLFQEADSPEEFFILNEGELKLEAAAGLYRRVSREQFVGDIALFGGMPHSSTAHAVDDCELLRFPAQAIWSFFQTAPRLGYELFDFFHKRLFMHVAEHSLIFSVLDQQELEKCWDYFIPLHVPAGKVLMEPAKLADRFFLTLKGRVEVQKLGHSSVNLGPGHFVGERGLVLKTIRNATLKTISDCHLLECDADSFEELCEDFPQIGASIEAREKELREHKFSPKNFIVD